MRLRPCPRLDTRHGAAERVGPLGLGPPGGGNPSRSRPAVPPGSSTEPPANVSSMILGSEPSSTTFSSHYPLYHWLQGWSKLETDISIAGVLWVPGARSPCPLPLAPRAARSAEACRDPIGSKRLSGDGGGKGGGNVRGGQNPVEWTGHGRRVEDEVRAAATPAIPSGGAHAATSVGIFILPGRISESGVSARAAALLGPLTRRAPIQRATEYAAAQPTYADSRWRGTGIAAAARRPGGGGGPRGRGGSAAS